MDKPDECHGRFYAVSEQLKWTILCSLLKIMQFLFISASKLEFLAT